MNCEVIPMCRRDLGFKNEGSNSTSFTRMSRRFHLFSEAVSYFEVMLEFA